MQKISSIFRKRRGFKKIASPKGFHVLKVALATPEKTFPTHLEKHTSLQT
jgi:hypothetical protein